MTQPVPARRGRLGMLLILAGLVTGPRGAPVSLRGQAVVPPDSVTSVVVMAVGDVVCGSRTPEGLPCMHVLTAELVRQVAPQALLLLGDLQYETGAPEDFQAYFDPAFGSLRDIMYPAPGNHEYGTRGARGYFDYFNGAGVDSGRAGSRRRGWYSFDLGGWHLVSLNSNCGDISGGCGARSPQARWLRDDLAAHPARCTLAYWHAARFSSGAHGDDGSMREIWPILQEFGVDVVLQGHDHDYERFAPLGANGKPDAERGIRSFVVGTGGKGNGRFEAVRAGSESRHNTAIGALKLELDATGYAWTYQPVGGEPPLDAGRDVCR